MQYNYTCTHAQHALALALERLNYMYVYLISIYIYSEVLVSANSLQLDQQ